MSDAIYCKTCGRMVSVRAEACAGCGEPMRSRNNRPVNGQMLGADHLTFGLWILGFCVLFTVLPVICCLMTNSVWFPCNSDCSNFPQSFADKLDFAWQHGVMKWWDMGLLKFQVYMFGALDVIIIAMLPSYARKDAAMKRGELDYTV